MREISILFSAGAIMLGGVCAAGAAVVARGATQSVTAGGTTVAARANANFVDAECQNIYNSCMDAICVIDNQDGGRCNCDDSASALHKKLNEITTTTDAAQKRARAQIDVLENDTPVRGNQPTQKSRASGRSAALLEMFNEIDGNDDTESDDPTAQPTGSALRTMADEMCREKLPDKCGAHHQMLSMLYGQQIKSDCVALSNAVKTADTKSRETRYAADKAVRSAALDKLQSDNRLDLGGCLAATRECMMGADACGANWENCAMPGDTIDRGLSAQTLERIDVNMLKCEHIRTECRAVADQVPDAFIAAYYPQILVAQTNADNNNRMACITDVSECIRNACQDDIAGTGTATMDACLAQPEMAQSFCKVELDKCNAARDNVWPYVRARLAAMRVDACTAEVKECFTAPDRCGADWSQCIGLDYAAMHEMCPVDKLVVCKQGNPDFSLSDLDNMIMGVYLGMDNALMEQCQTAAQQRMRDVCGDTNSCNLFANDMDMGASSLAHDANGKTLAISGTMNWMLVADADMNLDADAYLENAPADPQYNAARERVSAAINDVNAQIDAAITQLVTGDTTLDACINGRDMTQIRGSGAGQTTARMPHLMDQYKNIIRNAAITQASLNYSRKYMELKSEILKSADLMNAKYACYAMPIETDKRVYEMGMAMDDNRDVQSLLLRGNDNNNQTSLYALSETLTTSANAADIAKLAGRSVSNQAANADTSVTYEMFASFDEQTRECRVCTDGTMCTARKYNGDATGAGIKQLLTSMAISCAISTVTVGVGTAIAESAQAGVTAAEETLKETIKGGIEVTAHTTPVSDAFGTLAKAVDTADKVTKGVKITSTVAKTTSGVVGAGVSAMTSDMDKQSTGEKIGWMVGSVVAGTVAGATCGAIAAAVPIGTVVAAALSVVMGVAAATVQDENYQTECEVLERECTVIQM